MAGTMLGLFTAAMDQTVIATSMPRVIADLGGFGLFSWVGIAFMLASTTTVPIVGKLSDLYGRKPFYMAGIVVLLIGSALCGLSQSVEQLIAFRIVQGFGAGMIMGIAFAIVGDVFAPAERGRWMGLMSGVFAAASVIGPLIGGTLTDNVSWRWVFYINIPLGALALTVLFFGMPYIRPDGRAKVDYLGAALLCAFVVPLLLAFSWAGNRYAWVSPEIIGSLTWSGMALAVFTWWELRVEEPILQVSLFKMRVFSVSAVVTLITGFAMMGGLFYIPLFVQGVIGSSATNSGLVTMPMMIAMAVSSAISGQIMSRLGRYKILGIVGLVIMVAGMLVLSRLDVESTSRDVTMAMVIFGIGLGTSIPLFMLAVQNAVPYRVMGSSTSAMQFLRSVGGTMGIAVMFTIIQGAYHDGVATSAPAQVVSQPQLAEALKDPQFLLNGQALVQLQGAFQQFGADGQALFDQTILAVRTSLADGITDAFFISAFIMISAVVAAAFMKELPMRRTHMTEETPLADGVAPPAPRLRPAEAGAVGLDQVYPQ